MAVQVQSQARHKLTVYQDTLADLALHGKSILEGVRNCRNAAAEERFFVQAVPVLISHWMHYGGRTEGVIVESDTATSGTTLGMCDFQAFIQLTKAFRAGVRLDVFWARTPHVQNCIQVYICESMLAQLQ